MSLPAQSRVGGYRIIRKLAVGGMAEIFLAQLEARHGFTKQVVIKRILPHLCDETNFVDMFLHEARLAAHLNHPNIAQVFDVGESEGRVHYVMEYVHGPDLRAVAKRMHARGEGPHLDLVIGACIGVAAGLHYAHTARDEAGRPLAVVHRDVTPSNVVLTYDGAVKLLDFGVAKAKLEGRESTAVGVLKGKLPYMSPEQIDCGVALDGRSDVFSLGVILWELTTLARLYRCPSQMETIRRITGEDAPPPSSIRADYPPALEAIVLKALARDRDQRWADAFELQRALERFAVDHRLVVSASRLSELMADLFAEELEDERASLADEPREATDSEVFTHLAAKSEPRPSERAKTRVYARDSADEPTALEPTPSPSPSRAPVPSLAPRPSLAPPLGGVLRDELEPVDRGPRRWPWLAGAVGGLALVGLGLVLGRAGDTGPGTAQPGSSSPEAVPEHGPEAASDQVAGQTQEQIPEQVPEPVSEPAPEQVPQAEEAPTPAAADPEPPPSPPRSSAKKAKAKKKSAAKPAPDWNKNSLALPD